MDLTHSYFYSILWPRLRRNRLALFGGAVVLVLFVISLLAPLISPYDPSVINAWDVLAPPSFQHWFGTDELGRDVFSRYLSAEVNSLGINWNNDSNLLF